MREGSHRHAVIDVTRSCLVAKDDKDYHGNQHNNEEQDETDNLNKKHFTPLTQITKQFTSKTYQSMCLSRSRRD